MILIKVVQRLKLKNKEAYHFLNKAEICFQTSMYKLCKRFIHKTHIPALLSETLLKQLWKRKGKREILDNHRYIHLKEWKPRLTETLVNMMMKQAENSKLGQLLVIELKKIKLSSRASYQEELG